MHTRVKSAALTTASLVTAPSIQTTVKNSQNKNSTECIKRCNQNLPVFTALNHSGRFPRFRGSPLQEEWPTGAWVLKPQCVRHFLRKEVHIPTQQNAPKLCIIYNKQRERNVERLSPGDSCTIRQGKQVTLYEEGKKPLVAAVLVSVRF
ncbi:unnamed protein product [Ectocarpus sp. 12 AP-2014]